MNDENDDEYSINGNDYDDDGDDDNDNDEDGGVFLIKT